MNNSRDITFAFQCSTATSADEPKSDQTLYNEVIEDCRLGYELGYEAAWMNEHHCSDYFPTPSPLLIFAAVAREVPDLGLGTMVLVLPWYHPLRLAGELSMLNQLTRGKLHIGLGRGTAKFEYDAFGVAMPEARDRFAEGIQLVRKALAGGKFEHQGKFFPQPHALELRPRPNGKEINFYGAIGSPPSAGIMGDLNLPPLLIPSFPPKLMTQMLNTWRERTLAAGGNVNATLPMATTMLIADTDAEALALGQRYLPRFFELQCIHYDIANHPWDDIEGYQQFSKIFANLQRYAREPESLAEYMRWHLIGSPETVRRRIEELASFGFDYFVIGSNTPGVPKQLQRESLARFAKEVAPKLSRSFGPPKASSKLKQRQAG